MEENVIDPSYCKFENSKPIQCFIKTAFGQKCLIKQRIKAMHNRIFWRRNNSQSSLQKIKNKQTIHVLDKLQQIRKHNIHTKNDIQQLSKKLSLPKIRDTASFHCSKLRYFENHKIQCKQQSKIYNENNLLLEKEKKSQLNTINQVILRYNKRCNQENEEFSLTPTTLINQSFIEIQKENKKSQKKIDNRKTQGDFIPIKIVTYLQKYIR